MKVSINQEENLIHFRGSLNVNASSREAEELIKEFTEAVRGIVKNRSTIIHTSKEHYLEEALSIKTENIIETLIFLKLARKRAENGVIRIGKNSDDFSFNGELISRLDSDEHIDKKDFLHEVHRLVSPQTDFLDFCKNIVLTWEELSY